MSAIRIIISFFAQIFWSRRLGEEQGQMDRDFDRAVAHAKARKAEVEKLESAKSKLIEYESRFPEEKEIIESLRAAISEKENWLTKNVMDNLPDVSS